MLRSGHNDPMPPTEDDLTTVSPTATRLMRWQERHAALADALLALVILVLGLPMGAPAAQWAMMSCISRAMRLRSLAAASIIVCSRARDSLADRSRTWTSWAC